MTSRQEPLTRGLLYGAYQRRLRRQIDPERLPSHVAMIIDGNRRWARQLGFETVSHGHRAGAARMLDFLRWCDQLGVRVVTLYLLSSDNLRKRHSEELTDLIGIIAELADDIASNPTWRVQHVGSSVDLPEALSSALAAAEKGTSHHRGLHVNLAVGYGGRNEITDAMRSIVARHSADGGTLDSLAEILTPELIGEHLYTQGQPDPDLVIRTSGEQRMSDFMIWQSAHSEFYVVEALGPDLREVDFLRAVRDYSSRQRRYGG